MRHILCIYETLPLNHLGVSFRFSDNDKETEATAQQTPRQKKRNNLEPIRHRTQLDLNKPSDVELTAAEQPKMLQHLKFIRKFKEH